MEKICVPLSERRLIDCIEDVDKTYVNCYNCDHRHCEDCQNVCIYDMLDQDKALCPNRKQVAVKK